MKAKGIAAFSNKTRSAIISTAEAYPNKGTIPGTSKTITLRAYQAANTTYTTSDGQSDSYVDGDTVKIGANAKKGDVLTVTVTGTGANGEAINETGRSDLRSQRRHAKPLRHVLCGLHGEDGL